MSTVTIITPTGDRPQSFALLERWYGSQTRKPDQWIVVDDGRVPTVCTKGQQYIRRQPGDGRTHTLPVNLAASLPHVKGDHMMFWEDDEYYSPDYVQVMSGRLVKHSIIGECVGRYWCCRRRAYRLDLHRGHASLCRTAMRVEHRELMEELCGLGTAWIDLRLWERTHLPVARAGTVISVSFKNVPGRRIHTRFRTWIPDLEGVVLKTWVPEEVAKEYMSL